MRWVVVVLLAVVTLVGCAPAERTYIIGDEQFTPAERVEIQRGADFIAAATGKPVPEIRWEPLPDVGRERTIARTTLPENTAGSCPVGSFAVDIDADATGLDRLAAVSAHELGHALGLQHLPDGTPGLMQPHLIHTTAEWDAADMAACAAEGVCR